jgi:hypothetical protein
MRVVKLCKFLTDEEKGYVEAMQLLRCRTALKALLKAAEHTQSKADSY